ncbi:MAG: arsenate reductase ArsC [Acidobacteriaceae bacterium]|nr:arsenate reductase ArsC [Acidobacteriaceae bacterium]
MDATTRIPAGKKRVLFLCIGNSCRSQMAQGFARRYGDDVINCESAGLAPAPIVQPLTKKVMQDKNISIDDQHPKDVGDIPIREFDLIINMSGAKLPERLNVPVREWPIEDPIGRPEEVYVTVRDQIEMAVMQLILELRRDAKRRQPPARRPRNAPAAVSPKIP